MNRSIRNLLAASAAATAVAAAPVAAQAEDVTIGFLGGFTGPIESLVPPIFDGAQLAVDHVNAQGGILDGELEMVQGDTSCADTTVASSAADRMVNSEEVTALVGPLCSGATIAAANTAAIPGGVLMVSPAATSPALTDLDDDDLVFRTTTSDAFQGEKMAMVLREEGVESLAITYVNNDYGKGFADALEAAFEDQGGTVSVNEAHEDGKADYRAEIGSLAGAGAEMLAVLAYADGSGQTILRQAVEGGDFQRFAGGDGMVSDTLVPAIGEGMLDGMIATRPGSTETDGTPVFADLAEEGEIDPDGTFVPQSYDAAFLIALAIEKNGSGDREGLSEALREVATEPGEVILPGEWEKAKQLIADGEDINYEGAAGGHEFDDNGDVPGVINELVVEGAEFTTVGQIE